MQHRVQGLNPRHFDASLLCQVHGRTEICFDFHGPPSLVVLPHYTIRPCLLQHVVHLENPSRKLEVERMHSSIVNGRHVLRIKASQSDWTYLSFDSGRLTNEWHALIRIMSPFDTNHVERRLHGSRVCVVTVVDDRPAFCLDQVVAAGDGDKRPRARSI